MLSHGGFFYFGDLVMKYTKPPLSIDEQVSLLQSRGMEGDPSRIARRLKVVNYYRLSGYWYPFRNPDNTFTPGTNIEEVWNRYMFDRKLRLLVMDAIERIEVAVRTQVAYHQATSYGPFGYVEYPTALIHSIKPDTKDLIREINKDLRRSSETFMDHYRAKYGDHHDYPPIWVTTEVLSFGKVVALYRKSPVPIQKKVSHELGANHYLFDSWILSLNTVRNYCAHHSRIYNRGFTLKPKMPSLEKWPSWHDPYTIRNDRLIGIISICRHMMIHIAPNSKWAQRVVNLIDDHPNIPLEVMGMPINWREHALWRDV
jgi:abortive infection bacteriophage resistance protein